MSSIFRRLVVLFFVLPLALFAYETDLAIIAMFRNETRFLVEWIEYHKLVGVKRFYLYDNESLEDPLPILQPYIERNEVVYIPWRSIGQGKKRHDQCQRTAFIHGIKRAIQERVKWVALVDLDEFMVPNSADNLPEIFDRYSDKRIGGLYIKLINFGTSGVEKIGPDELSIERLVENGGRLIERSKLVYRPERIYAPTINPHGCFMRTGFGVAHIPPESLHINHYFVRDRTYLKRVKIPRYRRWGNWPRYRGWSDDEIAKDIDRKYGEVNHFTTSITRFAPELRKSVFSERTLGLNL